MSSSVAFESPTPVATTLFLAGWQLWGDAANQLTTQVEHFSRTVQTGARTAAQVTSAMLDKDFYAPPDGAWRNENLAWNLSNVAKTEILEKDPHGDLVVMIPKNWNREVALIEAPRSGSAPQVMQNTIQEFLDAGYAVATHNWVHPHRVSPTAGAFDLAMYFRRTIGAARAIHKRFGKPAVVAIGTSQSTLPVTGSIAVLESLNDVATPRGGINIAGPLDKSLDPTDANNMAEVDHYGLVNAYKASIPVAGSTTSEMCDVFPADLAVKLRSKKNSMIDREKGVYGWVDMPWKLFMDMYRYAFHTHDFAKGEFTFEGKKVVPRGISKTPMLMIGAENDDIVYPAQTMDFFNGSPLQKKGLVQTFLRRGTDHDHSFKTIGKDGKPLKDGGLFRNTVFDFVRKLHSGNTIILGPQQAGQRDMTSAPRESVPA